MAAFNLSGVTGIGRAVLVAILSLRQQGSVLWTTGGAAPPINTVLPVLSGAATPGSTLTTTTGTFTGSGTLTYATRWQRSTDTGASWSVIAGQTGLTYVTTGEAENTQIRAQRQATNSAGSSAWASSNVITVTSAAATAPARTTASTLTRNGDTITSAGSVWTGTAPLTFNYGWQRRTAGGGTWANIVGFEPGAGIANTFSIRPEDAGYDIRMTERAINSAGSTGNLTSANFINVAVTASAPVNTTAPTVSGGTTVGSILTHSGDTWTGSPTPTFTYAWQRSVSMGAWTAISGATSASYTLVSADAGNRVRLVKTGTNASGSASATSNIITVEAETGPTAGTLTNPPVSARLGVLDNGSARPFINHFKQATPWERNGGGMGWDGLRAAGHITDTGQIVSIPASGDPGIIARALYGFTSESGASGRWRLRWDGRSTVSVFGVSNLSVVAGNNSTANSNEIQFDFTTGDGGTNVAIVFTSISAGGGNIRNISLVHQEDWADADLGKIYRQQYLDEIRNYRCLRFDEWMGILRTEEAGGLRVTTWASRALPADEMFTRRYVPHEWQVELCHLVGADGWFILPTAATDDYFSNAATWFNTNYNDPKRVCYMEYSTKTWDFAGTAQAHYTADMGRIAFDTAGGGAEYLNWYGMRTTQMAQAFRAVWGSSTRLKVVIQNQADWVGNAYEVLVAPMWQSRNGTLGLPAYVAPHTMVDVLTVHAQLDGGMAYNYNGEAALMETWRASNSETVFFNMMRDQLLTAAHTHQSDTEIRTLEMMTPKWEDYIDMCVTYDLEIAFYEVGNHLNGVLRAAPDNPALMSALHRFSASAQMGTVYANTFTALQALPGSTGVALGPMCMSVEVRAPDDNIMHGLQRWLGDHNGAWTAVNAINQANNGPAGRGATDFIGSIET